MTLIIVFCCIGYSISAFAAKLLTQYGLTREGNPDQAEKFYYLASVINPFDSVPVYYQGTLLHKKGTGMKNMESLKEALKLFQKAGKMNPCHKETDLLILDTLKQLGKSRWWIFSELKRLNQKYPNDLMIEKFLAEEGLPLWNVSGNPDRELLIRISHDLLSCEPWNNLNIIGLFANATKDTELLKRIIPLKKNILPDIKYVLAKQNIKFDFLWLSNAMTAIETDEKAGSDDSQPAGKQKRLQEIKKEWTEKFGHAKYSLSNEELIGWFYNGREIPKGNMWSNGTLYGIVLLKPDSGKLIIRARSTKANDIPSYMLVSLDGKILKGCYVESSDDKEYEFPLNRQKETEAVISISFENDCCNPDTNEDRNLYIHSVEVR